VARREGLRLTAAVAARDASAERAREIETELGRIQERLRKVEPGERAQAEEIRRLENERESLRRKLEQLAEREAELRAGAARASELDEERRALEDLLEEAVEDLSVKEREIQDLQGRLERAARAPASRGRGRAAEHLERRLRTLYKSVEFDDRVVQDLLALGDETQRLRAEEGIRRLADDPETAAIRRKVGGLPPQLSIFELGFAGKGRIYYTRGRQQRYRVLAIGAKNTQKTDLEYLSRLPAE
jgi:chromosome segregation ATPase